MPEEDKAAFALHPCIEVNLRMNMGIIAHEIYCHRLAPEAEGMYSIARFSDNAALRTFHDEQLVKYPPRYCNGRLAGGYAAIKELYAVGGVSKAEFDNAKMSLEVAETQYNNIMENTQLLSPIDGIVTARNYDNGDLYSGAAILTVEQIRPVKLLVNVSENYYSKVEKGDKATITLDALPGETFTATVSLKYPTINAATHTFPVELTLANKDEKVRPGMFARAELNFGTESRVVVPDVAIVKQPGSGERFVDVYNHGKVNYVKVELGQRLGDAYELLGGVSDGATVVVAGQGRLTDGIEVRVEK